MSKMTLSPAQCMIVAVLVFVTLFARAARTDQEMLIEEEAAGWSRNIDRLLATFTDDVTYEDPQLGVILHGKEEVRVFAQGFFNAFPDLKSVITSVVVSNDRAAAEWRFTGTHAGDLPGMPASNKQMDLRGVSIYEFENGKIKRTVDYWDMATLLKQLGFMPKKQ